MKKPMAVTPAKIAANRRNAQKSTGPRTAAGKAISKLNALKHGVLAQSVVVRGHQIKESPHEFKKLCQEFYTSLSPVGPLEEMLVDQIIQAAWRLRRARTAESGEIALSVDEGIKNAIRCTPKCNGHFGRSGAIQFLPCMNRPWAIQFWRAGCGTSAREWRRTVN